MTPDQKDTKNFGIGFFVGLFAGAMGMWIVLAVASTSHKPQPGATTSGQPISQQAWDSALQAIRQQRATIEKLNADLAEAKANPAAHAPPAQNPPIPGSVTVIFERTNRQVDVNLSLKFHGLPLTNLPRFQVGPEGQLIPHWVFSGIVTPLVAGDDGGAIYYFFNNGQWNGPYPPQNVLQAQ